MQPRSLLWMHLLRSFVLPCLGGEERCYGSDMLHSFFSVVLLTHSTGTLIMAVLKQCWRQGLLSASLTDIHWTSHSWEEQARDFPPTLCPYTGGSKCQFHTVVCEDSCAFCICDPIQAAEEPITPQLEDTFSGWREIQSSPLGCLTHGRTGWTHPYGGF